LLPEIFQRATALTVITPHDGEPLTRGHVYIAPPDRHLLADDGRLRVVHGPKENRHRPAIDPLFRSVAWSYGPAAVGVVLTGTMSDGAAGLWAVQTGGGVTVVQDPADAAFPEMPTNALLTLDVDYRLPLDDIGPLLTGLVRRPVRAAVSPRPPGLRKEIDMVIGEKDTNVHDLDGLGTPSGFTCPACHGALWELRDGELVRYRCHVGHGFSAESLLDEQNEAVEGALQSALRALEEQAAAARRLSQRFAGQAPPLKERYERQAEEHEAAAAVIRRVANRDYPGRQDQGEHTAAEAADHERPRPNRCAIRR
jgi:two-component system chemotaxis response regulator CheB